MSQVLHPLRRAADVGAVLAKYPVAASSEDLVEVYRPLVQDLHADYVGVQVMSREPAATIRLLSEEVLPDLLAMR